MARSKREWVQVELKLGQGAEAWIIVRHRAGWFRLPADAPVGDVLRGVRNGWTASCSTTRSSGRVSVPLDEFLANWPTVAAKRPARASQRRD